MAKDIYRLAIPASLMIDVAADSPEEAIELGHKAVDDAYEGFDCPLVDMSTGEDYEGSRIYLDAVRGSDDPNKRITVEDWRKLETKE